MLCYIDVTKVNIVIIFSIISARISIATSQSTTFITCDECFMD